MKHLECVLVWWLDSEADQAWTAIEEITDGHLIPACGFVARESSQFLTLAISLDENGECIPYLSIPQVAIKKRKTLWKIQNKKTK